MIVKYPLAKRESIMEALEIVNILLTQQWLEACLTIIINIQEKRESG